MSWNSDLNDMLLSAFAYLPLTVKHIQTNDIICSFSNDKIAISKYMCGMCRF